MRLEGKVAVITGGASGIGLAATKRFAEEGARVAILDYNLEMGQNQAESFMREGYDVQFFQVDVSNEAMVHTVMKNVAEVFEGIDIVINNAGITNDSFLHKLTSEAFQQVLQVNVNGVLYCTQAALPYIIKKGKGRIINTSSVSGIYGNIGQTNYAASKAAVIGMTKTWAKELGRKGITVNAVAPGFVETAMVEKVPDKVIEQTKMLIPAGRLGQAEDIAHAYLFLASEEASYINGAVLQVDGGIMM
ncbi:3-oxoacyl-ACP reductase FabG [Bacillus coahuilensis]|uniref:3-oxoacyl-ACP reductase FabG n=1 Tax=Bacillus coahuilensis TaxID=408580 RepID=UPI0001850BB4|nr:3-oxoacyl-ACP reductase FabG [Bacillus coahuilensis]